MFPKIPGATHANLLTAGAQPFPFPKCMCRGGTWLGFEQAITRTENECVTIVPVTRLYIGRTYTHGGGYGFKVSAHLFTGRVLLLTGRLKSNLYNFPFGEGRDIKF